MIPFLCAALTIASPRVAFVGDSHLQALRVPLEREFREAGAEPVGTIARPGWSIRRYRLAGDLEDELRQARPDIVVLLLGSNDYGVRAARRYRPRAEWAIETARRSGARCVIWIGPPAGGGGEPGSVEARVAENHDAVAELQSQVVPALGVPWVDVRRVTTGYARADGFHLTARGYRRLAAFIRRAVLDGP